MKKLQNRIKAFAPLLSVVLVGVCVLSSLSGYEAPVYAAEDFRQMPENRKELPMEDLEEASATDKEAEETDLDNVSFDLADGIYKGTGTGFAGAIKVAVTIQNKQIKGIQILSNSEDAAFFNRAKVVTDHMVESQSLNVDTISGATYSSRGIIRAVKNALTGEKDNGKPGKEASGTAKASGGSKSVKKVKEAKSYKDGTYYGTGTGYGGAMKVKVVIKKGKITSIKIISHKDGSAYISKAKSLIKKMISGQTTNVDAASGATYSSTGLIKAVRNALHKAGGKKTKSDKKEKNRKSSKKKASSMAKELPAELPFEEDDSYKDGTYTGTAEGYKGDISVSVVIEEGQIKSIVVTDTKDDSGYMSFAKRLINKIISQQNTQVNTVSGATYSSRGVLNAVREALAKAKKSSNPGGDSGKDSGKTDDPKPEDKTSGGSDEPKESPTVYMDGTYTGKAMCEADEDDEFDRYEVTVKITVKNDKIVSVTDVTGDTDATNKEYLEIARYRVVKGIEKNGSTSGVDTVTGATCASKAIKKACEDALNRAKR